MGTGNVRRIDEKGRLTLPKDVRERLGLEPGDSVEVTSTAGRVVLRPEGTVNRSSFVEAFEGWITEDRRSDRAEDVDPLDLKRDWVGDLPT